MGSRTLLGCGQTVRWQLHLVCLEVSRPLASARHFLSRIVSGCVALRVGRGGGKAAVPATENVTQRCCPHNPVRRVVLGLGERGDTLEGVVGILIWAGRVVEGVMMVRNPAGCRQRCVGVLW